jgi:hypothetical protein
MEISNPRECSVVLEEKSINLVLHVTHWARFLDMCRARLAFGQACLPLLPFYVSYVPLRQP